MTDVLPVLIVTSQASHRNQIAEVVRKCALRPVFAMTLADARSILSELRPAAVFCGDELPDSDLLSSIHVLRSAARAPVIAVSHLAEWDSCVEAFSAGAFDYIACPPDPREAERVLRLAIEHGHAPYVHRTAA
jgi:DNA-binding NtrC family response regulator